MEMEMATGMVMGMAMGMGMEVEMAKRFYGTFTPGQRKGGKREEGEGKNIPYQVVLGSSH